MAEGSKAYHRMSLAQEGIAGEQVHSQVYDVTLSRSGWRGAENSLGGGGASTFSAIMSAPTPPFSLSLISHVVIH